MLSFYSNTNRCRRRCDHIKDRLSTEKKKQERKRAYQNERVNHVEEDGSRGETIVTAEIYERLRRWGKAKESNESDEEIKHSWE
ncbi:hypothetical protein F2Q69_00033923 [Brassica cretica]|uniref:Uncharacterized protein n=1 Tax=Brassica cretica TaxID=69181 RepID=A0A8S9SPN2_BRACR|nr:hypothetical protein F2Q69_00033923 [Brassica cretica]